MRLSDVCPSMYRFYFFLDSVLFSQLAHRFCPSPPEASQEDTAVHYQPCLGFICKRWRELWPRKADETGSILRGTDSYNEQAFARLSRVAGIFCNGGNMRGHKRLTRSVRFAAEVQ